MGKSQRTKGAVYERELCENFSNYFLRTFSRNIGQARDGGNDIDVGCLVVEAKRRASLKTLRAWLAQAEKAADSRYRKSYQKEHGVLPLHTYRNSADHIPVVVCREDGATKSMVLLSLDNFLLLVESEVIASLSRSSA